MMNSSIGHSAAPPLRSRSSNVSIIQAAYLPADILGEIFMECKPDIMSVNSPRAVSKWVNFTYACRRWRDIALELPHLWSDISNEAGPKWQECMLQRSKDVPISLFIAISRHSPAELAVPCLREQANRLKEIRIVAPEEQTLLELVSHIPSSAPLLDLLSLTNYGSSSAVIPGDPFKNWSTPKLQRLELRDCVISWSSPLFDGLISIVWVNYQLPRPPPEQFFVALSRMPSLTNLDFSDLLLPDMDSLPAGVELDVVSLNCLERLSLQGTSKECNNILKHLRIPTSCKIRLKTGSVDPDEFTSLFRTLSRSTWLSVHNTTALSFPNLRNVQIWKYPAAQLHLISGSAEEQDPLEDNTTNLNGIHIDSTLYLFFLASPVFSPTPVYDQTAMIAPFAASSNLRSLFINDPSSGEQWIQALSAASVLESIWLHYDLCPRLLHVLRSDPAIQLYNVTDHKSTTPLTYFSNLKIISFSTASIVSTANPEAEMAEEVFLDDLISTLVVRSELGAPRLQLHLHRCSFRHKSDPMKLREKLRGVADVYWDGKLEYDAECTSFLCNGSECGECA